MASKIKYSLCLVVMSLMAAFHVSAQYSEQDLISEANSLFEKGEFAEAMPLYSQLLSLNPTNPVFNYKYGATALFGDAEKKEEAVKYLRFSVGKPNVDDQSWYYLGRAYHLNYLFQDAISAYEKFKTLASKSEIDEKQVDLKISMARSGQNLLSQIKEIKVLDRKQSSKESFFRIYDLSDIGGKILVTPEELLSSEDKKRNHKSLIHFRGSGTTIYFSSYGKSGKTGLDIYHADVLPDGSFTEPIPVQGPVNTPYDEDFPYLHPDDQTFYFSSKGHGSMGGYDVYKSRFDKTSGVFSKPLNLDFAVNTPDDDLFYLADSLNEMAYFASARSSSQGQLDVYKVLVKSAPLDITLIKGQFANQIDPTKKLAKITTIDATTNKEVDVQYTDPATGEYVLSFPKGGKYKFLVEEKSSDKIHAGLVDVPTSAGVKAYLQEMELISSAGVEKLLINNLFDQTYEGDVMALAQKMLRQRAALDVNFDPEEEPSVQDTPQVEKDPDLAYSDAGFGAGLSNERILEQAEARVEELKDRYILAAQLTQGASSSSEIYFEDAKEKKNKAENFVDQAKSDGTDSNASMYDAGLAKLKAEKALQKAANSKNLKNRLYEKTTVAKAIYEAEKARVDSLRKAIDSADYDAIYAALTLEQEKRTSIDKVEDRFDPVQEVRRKGIKSDAEAQKLLERAQSLRDQEENLSASLVTKRTQRKKLDGKALKEIESEIAVLESDIESAKRKTERAFKQAEDAQNLADNEVQEYEILAEIAESNDPSKIPVEAEPITSWSESDLRLLEENLRDLPIDREAVAAYTEQHPEVFAEMDSEALAMSFRRTYAGGEKQDAHLDMASVENDETEIGEDVGSSSASNEADLEETALAEDQQNADSNDEIDQTSEESNQTTPDRNQNTEVPEITGGIVGTNLVADERSGEAVVENSVPTDLSIEYDESLPLDKRIEAEELKVQAAEDWVAIINESIEQLETGVGGEEGAEQQLADYRELRDQKANEIEQRQKLISEWNEERENLPVSEARDRAQADIDTLSPSLVARLESKISDYSTEISSVKNVSAIDRDYLPSLAEIEISGLSAPEMAEKRIELNERILADIDQILDQGIDSDVSRENLEEMRRVKVLEIAQDEAIMEGKTVFVPRSAEAKSYAELLNESAEVAGEAPLESESEYTELSPALAESLEEDYSRETILPDYSALIAEAELTTNPQIAQAQRLKVKEDFLVKLQSEISFYKTAIDAAETPDPKLVERYGQLLSERSAMIDDVNDEKAIWENQMSGEEFADDQTQLRTDSLISALRLQTIDREEASDSALLSENLDKATEVVAEQIEEYVTILDDPQTGMDRDAVQMEIQKLQAFQIELNDFEKITGQLDIAETSEVTEEETIGQEEIDPIQEQEAIAEVVEEAIEPYEKSEPDNFDGSIADENTQEDSDLKDGSDETEFAESALTEVQREEFEEILSLSEGFVVDFDKKASDLNKESDTEYRKLIALAELNEVFALTIEDKIDSLNRIKPELSGKYQEQVDLEIIELQALSADKQQESDRLLAEVDLIDMKQISEFTEKESSTEQSDQAVSNIPEIDVPDLASIQYKSLNASIIRNELKMKTDSLVGLRSEFERLTSDTDRAASLAKMERINAEVNAGIKESNFAEIEYYQSENRRILSQLDPANATNREEIILLQSKSSELSNEANKLELSEDTEDQLKLISELAAINASLGSFIQPESETDKQLLLGDMTASLLKPESHETLAEKAYLTNLQSLKATEMTLEEREELMAQDDNLSLDLSFSESNSVEKKRELLKATTKVDEIGMELLSETPEKLDYLIAVVRADSLKSLEQKSASYAKLKQNQAIERSAEADRLLKILNNQTTDQDRKIVKQRADKLENEAEVLYEKSSLAAVQAEKIRAKRSENDQDLIALSSNLSLKQRRSLDELLLKPGYRVISPEEPIAEVTKSEELLVEEAEIMEPEVISSPPVIPDAIDDVELSAAVNSEKTGLEDIKGNWLGMVEIIAEKDNFSDVEGSMFVEAQSSVYDEGKPIPLDPSMPAGLIFQVQVGAYRNPIPQDLFGPYAPIMGQKLDNGITRYRAGLFKKYNEAMQARNEIRQKGYSDAFVVVYVNGEKLTGEEARQILSQARVEETVNVNLISGIPSDEPLDDKSTKSAEIATPNTEYYNDPEAAEAAQVETMTGLFYTVQVGVYSKPVKLGQLYDLTELNSELTSSGVIRYTTGRFGDLKEAGERKDVARNKGVSDAFITAYYDGKRISLGEAENLLTENGREILADSVLEEDVSKPTSTEEMAIQESQEAYVVIMGTFVDEVPQDLVDLFLNNESWGIRKIQGEGGAAIYLTEDLPTLQDAKSLLEEVKRLNINSAAIGTIKNGQITSVQND